MSCWCFLSHPIAHLPWTLSLYFSMNFLSYINIMVRPSTTTTVWLSYACVFLLIVSCLFPYFDICINIISHISLASHNILVFLQTLTLSATSRNYTLIRVSFWLLQLFSLYQQHVTFVWLILFYPSFSNIDFYPLVHSRLASRESKFLDTNALLFSVST